MKKLHARAKEITLAAMVGFCFWIAFERIHDWYVENVPIGVVGECFNVRYPGLKDHFQMRIVENNNP